MSRVLVVDPAQLPPALPTLVLPCQPFGAPARLVLVLSDRGPLAAFWARGGRVTEAQIGRA